MLNALKLESRVTRMEIRESLGETLFVALLSSAHFREYPFFLQSKVKLFTNVNQSRYWADTRQNFTSEEVDFEKQE